jgi:acetoin utilization protein AcuB
MKHMPQIIAFMTPFPFSIDIEAPLAEARAFMLKQHIRHLPVTEAGRITGLVTDRDINLMLGPDFAYPPERELKVRDACVAEPYVVAASAPADEVATTMAERHIGSAVVTRDGKLVGVVTTTDVCRALARVLRERFPPPSEPADAA